MALPVRSGSTQHLRGAHLDTDARHGRDAANVRAHRPVSRITVGRTTGGSLRSGSLIDPGSQPLPLTTAAMSASPLRADAVLLSVAESLSGELFCGVPPFERDQAACATDGGGPANSVVFGWSQIWQLATEGDRRKAALGRSRLMFVHPAIVHVFDTRRGVFTFTATGAGLERRSSGLRASARPGLGIV